MRLTTAAEQLNPDAYREKHGRCPRGYSFDGERCVKTGQEAPDGPPAAPKGKGKGKGPAKPKQPKKPPVKPQGPMQEKTADNPYGLAEEVRKAKTLADVGGHEAIKKIFGHMDPSKYPPPGIDPATIELDMSGDSDSKALMKWRDGKGRRQAMYTKEALRRNAAVKWERVKRLEPKAEEAIGAFGKRMADTELSSKERDGAAIMAIIGKTGLRPGSTSGLKDTGNRGISTLSAKHVKIEGDTVKLDFIGKSGKRNQTDINDPELAAYLTERLKGKGEDDFLFEAREKDLPAVMKAVGLKGFKPKDFRTRKAGQIAADVMSGLEDPPPPMPEQEKKARKLVELRIKQASSAVADQLNNTPAIARTNYINPAIFQAWAQAVGAQQYVTAASKPTAEQLWKAALDTTLPGADKPFTADHEDDDQLDAVPDPDAAKEVEGAFNIATARLSLRRRWYCSAERRTKKEFVYELRRRQMEGLRLKGATFPVKEEIKKLDGIWDHRNKEYLMPSIDSITELRRKTGYTARYDASRKTWWLNAPSLKIVGPKNTTFRLKDTFKKHWSRWDGKNWNVPEDHVDELLKELKAQGVGVDKIRDELHLIESPEQEAKEQQRRAGMTASDKQIKYASILIPKLRKKFEALMKSRDSNDHEYATEVFQERLLAVDIRLDRPPTRNDMAKWPLQKMSKALDVMTDLAGSKKRRAAAAMDRIATVTAALLQSNHRDLARAFVRAFV